MVLSENLNHRKISERANSTVNISLRILKLFCPKLRERESYIVLPRSLPKKQKRPVLMPVGYFSSLSISVLRQQVAKTRNCQNISYFVDRTQKRTLCQSVAKKKNLEISPFAAISKWP